MDPLRSLQLPFVVPDLPGCVSAGATLDEAVAPLPSDVSEIIKAYQDALTYMAIQVDLDRLSAESERINITLPKWLISAIDSSESNRSRFLAESAIRALSEQQGRKAG